ncbi:MAG TPA: methylated-DNA--[protein]-cysteine S-methyltransferase [Candidatus Limnocylindrales bacterium]|nr:methylated-DNA--[protein]-cysteine S-methyltransferase [Candidatus Limnocylindrales bacterium]
MADQVVGYAVVDAPWGAIHVAASRDAVVAVELLSGTNGFVAGVARRIGEDILPGREASTAVRRMLDDAAAQITGYLAGSTSVFEVPIQLRGRAPWDELVLGGVRAVPWGSVTSYGRVAKAIGRRGAARAVGGAVGRNPIGLFIPCHRVIAGDGTLGGYGGEWYGTREALLDVKRTLLEIEGISLPATFAG